MRTTAMLACLVVLFGTAGCEEDEKAPTVPGGPVTAEAPEGVVSAPPGGDGSLPQVSDQAPEEEEPAKTKAGKPEAAAGEGEAKPADAQEKAAPGDAKEPAPATKAEPKSYDQACPAADTGLEALGLGKIQLTSDVKDKQPVDTIEATYAGEKVWAYLEVKNPTKEERCVAVIFEVGGRKRASLTLDVGHSPRWRTWAHVTVQKREVGKDVVITVQDDQGHELSKKTVPVKPGERPATQSP